MAAQSARDRKKVKMNDLEQDCETLRRHNQSLLKKNKILEDKLKKLEAENIVLKQKLAADSSDVSSTVVIDPEKENVNLVTSDDCMLSNDDASHSSYSSSAYSSLSDSPLNEFLWSDSAEETKSANVLSAPDCLNLNDILGDIGLSCDDIDLSCDDDDAIESAELINEPQQQEQASSESAMDVLCHAARLILQQDANKSANLRAARQKQQQQQMRMKKRSQASSLTWIQHLISCLTILSTNNGCSMPNLGSHPQQTETTPVVLDKLIQLLSMITKNSSTSSLETANPQTTAFREKLMQMSNRKQYKHVRMR